MRRLSTVLLMCLAILLSGCSSLSVNYDWDNEAAFPSYRTFAWVQQGTMPVGDAQAALARNSLLDQRIKRAVNTQLEGKGMRLDEQNPDLLCAYHTGVQEKVNVTDWGYRYGDAYWGYGGRNLDVTQYTEGTLIIDLIDANTTQLVWRASASKVIDDNVSPEKAEYEINNIVKEMLKPYPPEQ
jgi:hypothetical protein